MKYPYNNVSNHSSALLTRLSILQYDMDSTVCYCLIATVRHSPLTDVLRQCGGFLRVVSQQSLIAGERLHQPHVAAQRHGPFHPQSLLPATHIQCLLMNYSNFSTKYGIYWSNMLSPLLVRVREGFIGLPVQLDWVWTQVRTAVRLQGCVKLAKTRDRKSWDSSSLQCSVGK